MKRILIGDFREELLSTLEVILKNWGYRTLVTSNADEFLSLLDELEPDLVIAGPALLANKSIAKTIDGRNQPLLIVTDPTTKSIKTAGSENLDYPVDVFKLFELTQKSLEKIPRRNIRLNVQLPSMYYHGEAPCIAEVVSISSEGLFIKTGSRIEGLTDVRIVLPLLGMQEEIEVLGRIVYSVEPSPENNYLQGMGIEFLDIPADTNRLLQKFVENLLVTELSDKRYTQDSLNLEQLQSRTDDMLLKISAAKSH